MTTELKWDVAPKVNTSHDDLRIQLVKALLDRMTPEQMRSELFHLNYLQYNGLSEEQLYVEAKKKGVTLSPEPTGSFAEWLEGE